MSLLPDDSVNDVEFGLHESYDHDADMGFPNDFGTEEIASELNVQQDILTAGVDMSEDHHFEVPLHDDCHVKDELNPDPASELLADGEDGEEEHDSGQMRPEDDGEDDDEDDADDQHPGKGQEDDELLQHQGEVGEERASDDVYREDQQVHHLNHSEGCEMEEGNDFEADEDFEKNFLEPEVDLIEEEQTEEAKPAFRLKTSGQPNVVRRFSRNSRPPPPVNTYTNGCLSGDEDEDEEDQYDCEPPAKDDRRGCRSLVCDSNSIIIAEMVYRCLICAHVTESIGDAQRHYHKKHMREKCKKTTDKSSSHPGDGRAFEKQSEHGVEEDNNEEEDYSGEDLNNFSGNGSQSTVTFDVPSSLKQLQQTLAPDSQGNSNSSESGNAKKPGNFVYSPSPADYVPGRNANKALNPHAPQNANATRGGYVTCAVCNITKYYASVQRRYGQFTCMGCAKFFGRFLIKPRRYYCPNLGSCPLDISPRCKACLLLACISTYNIDEKRMRVVNANRPLKKSGQPPSRPQVLTSINTQPNAGHSSLTFAPPPLVKAPGGQRQSPASRSSQQPHHHDEQPAEPHAVPLTAPRQQQRISSIRSPVRSPVLTASRSLNNFSPVAPALASGRKGTGCRQCSNCLSDDCGKCNYCLDKPKFGGPNTLKKKCIQKKCLLIQPNSNPRMRLIRK